jgi:hypothetical protein
MSKRVVVVGCIVLGVALLAFTFIAGVRVGATESPLSLSTMRATMLVGELKALRAGKTDQLIRVKELELDSEILLYQRFSEHGMPWLLWPDSENLEHDRYLRQVALYRKEFPAVLSQIEVTGTDEMSTQMRAQHANLTRTTEMIIRRFGQ